MNENNRQIEISMVEVAPQELIEVQGGVQATITYDEKGVLVIKGCTDWDIRPR